MMLSRFSDARLRLASLVLAAVASQAAAAPEVEPPIADKSVRFAVIGDSGTGDADQYAIAERLVEARAVFPFDFVIMLGDNLYGSERPQDYARKFERPYKLLLDAGVKFYASLGNHDDPNQQYYKPFNMNGRRYYSFTQGPVRFFVLDSNYLDREQLAWIEKELGAASESWKIAYFHHPLYSSGAKHGSEEDLRALLEPLFVEFGVGAVFAGHEHFYERLKPQKGIYYFISGAAAKLRRGDVRKASGLTERALDTDRSFMLVEITAETLSFQAIARSGKSVDRGRLIRAAAPAPTGAR
jgi:3',5'-cyclic AMP phosphodiesterase CpdA